MNYKKTFFLVITSTVLLRAMESPQPNKVLRLPTLAQLSPDGTHVAYYKDGNLSIVNCQNQKIQQQELRENVFENESLEKLVWSPQGNYVYLLRLSVPAYLFEIEPKQIHHIIQADSLKTVSLFKDIHEIPLVREFKAFSPDETRVLALMHNLKTKQASVRLQKNNSSLTTLQEFCPHPAYAVTTTTFSPDGSLLAVGLHAHEYQSYLCHIFNAKTGKQLKIIDTVSAAIFSPDSAQLIVGTSDEKINKISCKTFNCVEQLDAHQASKKKSAITQLQLLGSLLLAKTSAASPFKTFFKEGKKFVTQAWNIISNTGRYIITPSDVREIIVNPVQKTTNTLCDLTLVDLEPTPHMFNRLGKIHLFQLPQIQFSPNDEYVLIPDRQEIKLFLTKAAVLIKSFTHRYGSAQPQMSDDSNYLLLQEDRVTSNVWNLPSLVPNKKL